MQSIDNDWNLHNLPVAFAPITGPHTAEAVGTLVASLLTPFLGMISQKLHYNILYNILFNFVLIITAPIYHKLLFNI
jgi:hypothetical protein